LSIATAGIACVPLVTALTWNCGPAARGVGGNVVVVVDGPKLVLVVLEVEVVVLLLVVLEIGDEVLDVEDVTMLVVEDDEVLVVEDDEVVLVVVVVVLSNAMPICIAVPPNSRHTA
jgi:hypothetical protein